MEIVMRKVSGLAPYEKNAKQHDKKQIDNVANSIRRFGWQQPIVVDENGVVVIGHCRLLAAKKLKHKEVPCVIASGLTDEEIRELRIADNKTNESPWDLEMLDIELHDLDFDGFDFDFPQDETEEKDGSAERHNEAERTGNAYNLSDYDPDDTEGKYQMPKIHPVSFVPKDLIGFNYALTSEEKHSGIHFFIDDYQFERVWNQPQLYLEKLSKFQCMLTPDFSLYTDMPVAMKIWNVYRSRLVGQMAQRNGLVVIPTVSWSEKETFEFCFDGLPHGGTLAISTIGIKNSPQSFDAWSSGVDEMLKRLSPKTLLVYGGRVDHPFHGVDVVYFENKVTERMKNIGCDKISMAV